MKKALICLEKLGIGGVETFTITQVEEFSRRNIKCYVLAQNGILAERLKNLKNVEFFEFEFKLEDKLDEKKIDWVTNFIKEKKIDFIYVHQFPCALYILPAAFKTKVPYVAYLHNIVPKTCEWFMDTYNIFKVIFPIYFEYASKIIAIADKVKEEHKTIFHLPDEKYMVINNSLDFNKYPDKLIKKISTPYKTLLWFGRVSELKRNSIETAVDFYHYCKENYNQNIKLNIVGDGEIYTELVEKYQDPDIIFKGAVADMTKEIEHADVLLGVDRCMLEAVASKKPSVICGYNKNTVFITPENIKVAVKDNFTGANLEDNKEELFNYKGKELIKILNENYSYIEERLSIKDSVYLDVKPFQGQGDLSELFNGTNTISTKIKELEKENKELYLKNQELYQQLNDLNRKLNKSVLYRIKNKISK